MSKSVLMVVTSFWKYSETRKTGLWFEEFAVPFKKFVEAGAKITVASIQGGDAPIDPESAPSTPEAQAANAGALEALKNTQKLSALANRDSFDAVFVPGGHGTMWDFPDDKDLIDLMASYYEKGKVIGIVCHGPACLVGVKLKNGEPLVKGKRVTSFTNSEEAVVKATKNLDVPFLLEDRLKELGAIFVSQKNWADNLVVDGRLITGQNPQSSASTAGAVLAALK